MPQAKIGLVGLAVMGENLALNIERNGFPIAVFNRTTSKVDALLNGRARDKKFVGCHSPQELVAALERPRCIILMVKSGQPVDAMIDQFTPLLEKGDILIDAGNSFYQDTERRMEALTPKGIHFVGMGVSGGEEGALWGPSIMPGGPKAAWKTLEPILTKIAAQVDDGPCTTYIGPGGAGHFVKMVHNGIEYGDMQLIAEAYHLLQVALDAKSPELAEIFGRWNEGSLSSYLIEITAKIFGKKDDLGSDAHIVDLILDKAGQKGTGKWTSQVALDLGVPTPTINAAVEARILSAHKDQRVAASAILRGPKPKFTGEREKLIDQLEQALLASKICSYAQGMHMIQAVSDEKGWKVNLAETARIWKGGCIIRAEFLGDVRAAFAKRRKPANLMLDRKFKSRLHKAAASWRRSVQLAVKLGVPIPAMSASLAYFDSYRTARLPQNLTQAQRDFFGAHTYERTDRPDDGPFHFPTWAE